MSTALVGASKRPDGYNGHWVTVWVCRDAQSYYVVTSRGFHRLAHYFWPTSLERKGLL